VRREDEINARIIASAYARGRKAVEFRLSDPVKGTVSSINQVYIASQSMQYIQKVLWEVVPMLPQQVGRELDEHRASIC
jgi:dihydroxyacetone kinase-like predicted kinase